MTKPISLIDQHRQALGKHENKRHKPQRTKPLVNPGVDISPGVQQKTPKDTSQDLTAQQRRARAKQRAAHRRAEPHAHVNILPSAALTVLAMLTLLPQPVEAKTESKQKSTTGNGGVARVSLSTLEREGKAQNVFFPHTPTEGLRHHTSGIGFDTTARLLALLKTETTQHYRHAKGKVDSQPMTRATMEYVDLTKTEGCLTDSSLNASCALSASARLPGAYGSLVTGRAATNGDYMVVNSGPLIPSENICLDTAEPSYYHGADPSQNSVILNSNIIYPDESFYSFERSAYYAPAKTLKTGLELVYAEHTNVLGEADASLLLKGVVVKQEDGVIASTLYVNQYKRGGNSVDFDPLCVVLNAGEILESKLSVVVDENGQVKRRDLVLAHLTTPESSEGKVIIIRDIDHRQGQNIDLNADPKAQNIQVLSGFNWGDAKARGENLIDVIDQEIETFDSDSIGLDEGSTGESDTDSIGLTSVQQGNFLLVSSSGEKDSGSYLRPRAFIIDADTHTYIGIQDQSDTANLSDLGYAVITAGELSRQFPEGKWFYSNYPVVTRPSTGELFILSPQKIAVLMAEHKGESILVDVSQLSELVIDDPELRCPELGKKLFASEETGQLGMECGHAENSTTMEVVRLQDTMDSAPHYPRTESSSAPDPRRVTQEEATSSQAAPKEANILPDINCGTFWSKNAIPLTALGATVLAMGTFAGCLFFRPHKRTDDIESAPINGPAPTEVTPLIPSAPH